MICGGESRARLLKQPTLAVAARAEGFRRAQKSSTRPRCVSLVAPMRRIRFTAKSTPATRCTKPLAHTAATAWSQRCRALACPIKTPSAGRGVTPTRFSPGRKWTVENLRKRRKCTPAALNSCVTLESCPRDTSYFSDSSGWWCQRFAHVVVC
jgi:hypothetical protein